MAHAATYLAMLHGADAASAFEEAYGPIGDDDRYWRVMDLVGYLPDPVKVCQPWRDHGVAITDDDVRTRLEQRLRAVLTS